MSASFHFIPKIDVLGGLTSARTIDVTNLGDPRQDAAGISFPTLGREIGNSESRARKALISALKKAWGAEVDDVRIDAATDFLISGLEQVGGPAENIERPQEPTLFVPGPGRTLALPSRNVLRPGMRENSYKIRQRHGEADWVSPDAVRELNRAGYQDEKVKRGAEWYGIAYGYTIPQEWEASHLGDDLLGENQMAATEALDDFRERVSTWGAADKEIAGFATLSDAVILAGGQQFGSLVPTAEQMLQRLAAFEQRYMLANQNRRPTKLLAPYSDKLAMQNRYFTGTSDSAWDKAVERYPWLANAIWDDRMLTANESGDAARWILYAEDPRSLYIEHTESMLFGPFQDYMEFTFIILRRHGGVVSKLPERVFYVDFTV